MLQNQDLRIVAEASDGLEAVRIAEELAPDLVLLDISLPILNGIEVALRIKQVSYESKILFVSENRCVAIASSAMSTGADGYVLKSDAALDLLPAVQAVLAGKQFVSASMAQVFDEPLN